MNRKISILLSLILILCSLTISGERLSPCINSDDCGKVIGWIIDYDSGMVIFEKFAITFISIIDGKPNPSLYYELIANSGDFSISLKQGQYRFVITPYSEGTRYPYHFDPYSQVKEGEVITVEKGKIIEIRKKLQMGGTLKVVLRDSNGEKIDIIQKYSVSKITFNLINQDVGYYNSFLMEKEKIETDEMIISNIVPGVYGINAYFPENGYGPIKGGTALIESKKTTEYIFVINLDENTGIHGLIKDVYGVPVEKAEVIIFKHKEGYGVVGFGSVVTNKDGYYKICGIKEGVYRLRIEKEEEFYLDNIIISKNKLLVKDITLKSKN